MAFSSQIGLPLPDLLFSFPPPLSPLFPSEPSFSQNRSLQIRLPFTCGKLTHLSRSAFRLSTSRDHHRSVSRPWPELNSSRHGGEVISDQTRIPPLEVPSPFLRRFRVQTTPPLSERDSAFPLAPVLQASTLPIPWYCVPHGLFFGVGAPPFPPPSKGATLVSPFRRARLSLSVP